AFDRKELHERKFASELGAHPARNRLILRAMKSRDARYWIQLHRATKICAVVVTLDQQMRHPTAEDARRFFSQCCEWRDQDNFLHPMIRGEIERDRRPQRMP